MPFQHPTDLGAEDIEIVTIALAIFADDIEVVEDQSQPTHFR